MALSKKKTIALAVSVLAVIALLLTSLWFLQVHKKFQQYEPLSYMPQDADILLKFNSFDSVQIWSDSVSLVKSLQKEERFHFLKEINNLADTLRAAAKPEDLDWIHQPLWIALFTEKAGKDNFVVTFPIPDLLTGRKFTHLVKKLLRVNPKKVQQTTIWECQTTSGQTFFFHLAPGAALLTTSDQLLYRCATITPDSSLINSVEFQSIYRTQSSTAPVNAFLRFDTLTNHQILLAPLFDEAGWVGLDLEKTPKGLSVNGFAQTKPSGVVKNLLQSLNHGPITLDAMVPDETLRLIAFGSGTKGLENKAFEAYLKSKNLLTTYASQKQEQKSRYGLDIEERLATLFQGEMALANLSSQQNLVVLKSRSGSIATQEMVQILQALRRTEEKPLIYSPNEYLQIPIYKAFENTDTLYFLKHYFPKCTFQYFASFQNTLFFAETVETIEQSLAQVIQDQPISNNNRYKEFKKQFASQQQFWLFMDGIWLKNWIQTNSKTNNNPRWMETLDQLPAIGIQFSTVSNLLYTAVSVEHEANRTPPLTTIWHCRLDTIAAIQPYAVFNSFSKKYEWVVQDKKNNIYWIEETGKIRWKKQLQQPLIGSIQSIDFFKNNKFQLLLTTANQLHLIDRTGAETAPFPITLKKTATAGVTILDYEKSGEYRFFIPIQTPTIQLLDKKGSTVEGWSMKTTEKEIINPLQHFEIQGKDFLVCNDENRPYLFDRKGKERLVPRWNWIQSENAGFIADAKNNQLLTLTQEGELASISILDGSTAILWKPLQPMDHPFLFTEKASGHTIVADARQIVVLDQNLTNPKTFASGLKKLSHAELYENQKSCILLFDSEMKKSILFRLDGEKLGEHPSVTPSTLHNIGSRTEWITCDSIGKINAYQIVL